MFASKLCVWDKTDSKSKWIKEPIDWLPCLKRSFFSWYFCYFKICLCDALFQVNKWCMQREGIIHLNSKNQNNQNIHRLQIVLLLIDLLQNTRSSGTCNHWDKIKTIR